MRNGILRGVSSNNLAPKSNATQAELSTILARILKTEKAADLTAYTGAAPNSWYYGDLQRTVCLGLFPIADPSSKKLQPNQPVTREEVFVVLARVFGLKSGNRQAIYRFPDWAQVSDWAAEPLAAMIEKGFVNGSSGKLLPKAKITREELAQVLYNLLSWIGTDVESGSYSGRLALAAASVPADTKINGDLLLSTDCRAITLERLTVTGRLILQGNDLLRLNLKQCSIHELVVCRPTELTSDQTLESVVSHALFRLNARAKTVNCFDCCVVVLSGATAETVNLLQKGRMTVAQGGTVKLMNVLADGVYVNGLGRIDKAVVRGKNFWNECANTGARVNNPYKTVKDAVATRTDAGAVSEGHTRLNLGLKLSKMPEGWSECDVKWYIDGAQIAAASRSLLKEGSVISTQYDFSPYQNGAKSKVELTVSISCGGVTAQIHKGSVDLQYFIQKAARNVRTQNVQAKLCSAGTLYAYQNNLSLNTPIGSYAAGTQVTVLQSRSSSVTKIRMPDGKVGWTNFKNVAIIPANYYTTTDYPVAVKEYYVNQVRKCSSQTGYLIWVSLYTQRVNIFKGSKGNWKLVRSGPIASGMNYCPTPVEDTKILYKVARWTYAKYYCHHVSVFDEARGFHSRPTAYSGGIYSATIGVPASAGCVRLLDEDCTYIYDNCPVNTAVHIY